MENVAREFAATVINARNEALVSSNTPWRLTESDFIDAALAVLWQDGLTAGYRRAAIAAIADRFVEYDAAGNSRARPVAGNVVPFRR